MTAICLATALASAAHAADEGLGVATEVAGMVAALTERVPIPPSPAEHEELGTEELAGKCTYAGVTTVNGRIIFTFGGAVEAYSTSPSQPQATSATCRFVSPTQPGVPGSDPAHDQLTTIALAGAVAATPPAQTPPLQLRPVVICVSGFGVYGPTPPEGNPKYLPETCKAAPLD